MAYNLSAGVVPSTVASAEVEGYDASPDKSRSNAKKRFLRRQCGQGSENGKIRPVRCQRGNRAEAFRTTCPGVALAKTDGSAVKTPPAPGKSENDRPCRSPREITP